VEGVAAAAGSRRRNSHCQSLAVRPRPKKASSRPAKAVRIAAATRNGSVTSGTADQAESKLDQLGQGQADAAAPARGRPVDRAADHQAGRRAEQGDAAQRQQQRAPPSARLAPRTSRSR
jgi:hypothetical protein